MFEFAAPYSFLLLVPYGAAVFFVYRRRVRHALIFAPTFRVPHRRQTWRVHAAAAAPALVLLGLLCAIVALARPRTFFAMSHDTSHVIAIEMVVDVSGSMEALDLSVQTATGTRYRSRLDAVKETFAEFVGLRPDDLIGLITFGGFASTRAPLTTDKGALLHVLKGVEIPRQDFDKDGQIVNQEELMTAVGDALATACARLDDCEPQSRIIVLLSDGESNTGIIKPEQAIDLATDLGVKVYTIGIGTSGRAPFRGRDLFGRETIQYAQVTLDEALLKRIAEATGGTYFNVRNPKGLEQALEEIDKLEKTEVRRDVYHLYDELFHRFLGPAVALLFAGFAANLALTRRLI